MRVGVWLAGDKSLGLLALLVDITGAEERGKLRDGGNGRKERLNVCRILDAYMRADGKRGGE